MRVKFKEKFFGPGEAVKRDNLFRVAGQRFRRGHVYDLDEGYIKDHVPADIIELLDEMPADAPVAKPAPVENAHDTFSDFDELKNLDRAAQERIRQITEDEDKQPKSTFIRELETDA